MQSPETWRPVLRTDVIIGPPERRAGRTIFYVKDRATRFFLRVGEREAFALLRLNGMWTLDEISGQIFQRFGYKAEAPFWNSLFSVLHRRRLLESSAANESVGELTEPAPASRPARGILERQFPLFDPDRLLAWCCGYMQWLFNPAVLGALLLAVAVSEAWVLFHLGRIESAVGAATGRFGSTIWITFGLLFFLSEVVHEMSHGLACRYYGGEVHEIGIMFRYVNFYPYCKLDDMVLLQNYRHRVAIAFAGTFASLLFMVPFTFAAATASPDGFIQTLSLLMVGLYNGIALLNLLPFLQLDGYLMLAHGLKLPELRGDTLLYWGARIRKQMGKPVREPNYTARERRIYQIYGATSLVATFCLVVFSLARWHRLFVSLIGAAWSWSALALVFIVLVALSHKRLRNWEFLRVVFSRAVVER